MSVPASHILVKADSTSASFAAGVSGHVKTTQIQSFHLDNDTGYLWTLQATRLETGSDPKTGDLTLTRLEPDGSGGWQTKDHMDLVGFGHGVAFGVEYHASPTVTTYIWSECVADASTGIGRSICHFHYDPGSTLHNSDVTALNPVANAYSYSCVARTQTNVLVVRYYLGGRFYRAFNLSDATNNNFASPLTGAIPEPSIVTASTMNGWTFQGQFLYMLDGPGGIGNPVKTTSLDLNLSLNTSHTDSYGGTSYTGSYIARGTRNVNANSGPREPEGMSFDTRGSNYDLLFGLTHYASGATRTSDLFHMDQTVSV